VGCTFWGGIKNYRTSFRNSASAQLPFEGGFTGAMDVVFLELRAIQSIFSMLQQTNDGATGALET